jgi:hypothetical protein
MDDETRVSSDAGTLDAGDLATSPIEALVVRFHGARRAAVLARARKDYQDAINAHREAVHYERLVAANEKMAQAERRAIVEAAPEVLKGRQQSIVHAKDAGLWSAEAEALRLYLMTRARVGRVPADDTDEPA